MTDQVEPDEVMPSVHFSLRNVEGDAGDITLNQHTLGLEPYLLIGVGDDGPQVESSHLSVDELAGILGFVLATALQVEQVSKETRAAVVAIINDAVQEER